MADTPSVGQGCEIRLGRIKSYGIRGRIHSYSHTTNTNTSTKNMERIRVDTRYDPVVFFPVVWIRGRIDTRSYGLVFLYKYNTNTTFFTKYNLVFVLVFVMMRNVSLLL